MEKDDKMTDKLDSRKAGPSNQNSHPSNGSCSHPDESKSSSVDDVSLEKVNRSPNPKILICHDHHFETPLDTLPGVGKPYIPLEERNAMDGIRPSASKTRALALLPAIDESVEEDKIAEDAGCTDSPPSSTSSVSSSPSLIKHFPVQRVSSKPTLMSISEELISRPSTFPDSQEPLFYGDENERVMSECSSLSAKSRGNKTKLGILKPFSTQGVGHRGTVAAEVGPHDSVQKKIDKPSGALEGSFVPSPTSKAGGEGITEKGNGTKNETAEINLANMASDVSGDAETTLAGGALNNAAMQGDHNLSKESAAEIITAKASVDGDSKIFEGSACENTESEENSALNSCSESGDETMATSDTQTRSLSSEEPQALADTVKQKNDTEKSEILTPCVGIASHSPDLHISSIPHGQKGDGLQTEWSADLENQGDLGKEEFFCLLGEEQAVPMGDVLKMVHPNITEDIFNKPAACIASLNIYINQIVLGSLCEVIVQLALKNATDDAGKTAHCGCSQEQGESRDERNKLNPNSTRPKSSESDSMVADNVASSVDVSCTPRESHSEHTAASTSSERQDKDFKEKESNKQRDKDVFKPRGRERERNKRKKDREDRGSSCGKQKLLRNAKGDETEKEANDSRGDALDNYGRDRKTVSRPGSQSVGFVDDDEKVANNQPNVIHIISCGNLNRVEDSGDVREHVVKTTCGLESQTVTAPVDDSLVGGERSSRRRITRSESTEKVSEDDKIGEGKAEMFKNLPTSRFGKRTSLHRQKQTGGLNPSPNTTVGESSDNSGGSDVTKGTGYLCRDPGTHQEKSALSFKNVYPPHTPLNEAGEVYPSSSRDSFEGEDMSATTIHLAFMNTDSCERIPICNVCDESFNHPPKYTAENPSEDWAPVGNVHGAHQETSSEPDLYIGNEADLSHTTDIDEIEAAREELTNTPLENHATVTENIAEVDVLPQTENGKELKVSQGEMLCTPINIKEGEDSASLETVERSPLITAGGQQLAISLHRSKKTAVEAVALEDGDAESDDMYREEKHSESESLSSTEKSTIKLRSLNQDIGFNEESGLHTNSNSPLPFDSQEGPTVLDENLRDGNRSITDNPLVSRHETGILLSETDPRTFIISEKHDGNDNVIIATSQSFNIDHECIGNQRVETPLREHPASSLDQGDTVGHPTSSSCETLSVPCLRELSATMLRVAKSDAASGETNSFQVGSVAVSSDGNKDAAHHVNNTSTLPSETETRGNSNVFDDSHVDDATHTSGSILETVKKLHLEESVLNVKMTLHEGNAACFHKESSVDDVLTISANRVRGECVENEALFAGKQTAHGSSKAAEGLQGDSCVDGILTISENQGLKPSTVENLEPEAVFTSTERLASTLASGVQTITPVSIQGVDTFSEQETPSDSGTDAYGDTKDAHNVTQISCHTIAINANFVNETISTVSGQKSVMEVTLNETISEASLYHKSMKTSIDETTVTDNISDETIKEATANITVTEATLNEATKEGSDTKTVTKATLNETQVHAEVKEITTHPPVNGSMDESATRNENIHKATLNVTEASLNVTEAWSKPSSPEVNTNGTVIKATLSKTHAAATLNETITHIPAKEDFTSSTVNETDAETSLNSSIATASLRKTVLEYCKKETGIEVTENEMINESAQTVTETWSKPSTSNKTIHEATLNVAEATLNISEAWSKSNTTESTEPETVTKTKFDETHPEDGLKETITQAPVNGNVTSSTVNETITMASLNNNIAEGSLSNAVLHPCMNDNIQSTVNEIIQKAHLNVTQAIVNVTSTTSKPSEAGVTANQAVTESAVNDVVEETVSEVALEVTLFESTPTDIATRSNGSIEYLTKPADLTRSNSQVNVEETARHLSYSEANSQDFTHYNQDNEAAVQNSCEKTITDKRTDRENEEEEIVMHSNGDTLGNEEHSIVTVDKQKLAEPASIHDVTSRVQTPMPITREYSNDAIADEIYMDASHSVHDVSESPAFAPVAFQTAENIESNEELTGSGDIPDEVGIKVTALGKTEEQSGLAGFERDICARSEIDFQCVASEINKDLPQGTLVNVSQTHKNYASSVNNLETDVPDIFAETKAEFKTTEYKSDLNAQGNDDSIEHTSGLRGLDNRANGEHLGYHLDNNASINTDGLEPVKKEHDTVAFVYKLKDEFIAPRNTRGEYTGSSENPLSYHEVSGSVPHFQATASTVYVKNEIKEKTSESFSNELFKHTPSTMQNPESDFQSAKSNTTDNTEETTAIETNKTNFETVLLEKSEINFSGSLSAPRTTIVTENNNDDIGTAEENENLSNSPSGLNDIRSDFQNVHITIHSVTHGVPEIPLADNSNEFVNQEIIINEIGNEQADIGEGILTNRNTEIENEQADIDEGILTNRNTEIENEQADIDERILTNRNTEIENEQADIDEGILTKRNTEIENEQADFSEGIVTNRNTENEQADIDEGILTNRNTEIENEQADIDERTLTNRNTEIENEQADISKGILTNRNNTEIQNEEADIGEGILINKKTEIENEQADFGEGILTNRNAEIENEQPDIDDGVLISSTTEVGNEQVDISQEILNNENTVIENEQPDIDDGVLISSTTEVGNEQVDISQEILNNENTVIENEQPDIDDGVLISSTTEVGNEQVDISQEILNNENTVIENEQADIDEEILISRNTEVEKKQAEINEGVLSHRNTEIENEQVDIDEEILISRNTEVEKGQAEIDEGVLSSRNTEIEKEQAEIDEGVLSHKNTEVEKEQAEIDEGVLSNRNTEIENEQVDIDEEILISRNTEVEKEQAEIDEGALSSRNTEFENEQANIDEGVLINKNTEIENEQADVDEGVLTNRNTEIQNEKFDSGEGILINKNTNIENEQADIDAGVLTNRKTEAENDQTDIGEGVLTYKNTEFENEQADIGEEILNNKNTEIENEQVDIDEEVLTHRKTEENEQVDIDKAVLASRNSEVENEQADIGEGILTNRNTEIEGEQANVDEGVYTNKNTETEYEQADVDEGVLINKNTETENEQADIGEKILRNRNIEFENVQADIVEEILTNRNVEVENEGSEFVPKSSAEFEDPVSNVFHVSLEGRQEVSQTEKRVLKISGQICEADSSTCKEISPCTEEKIDETYEQTMFPYTRPATCSEALHVPSAVPTFQDAPQSVVNDSDADVSEKDTCRCPTPEVYEVASISKENGNETIEPEISSAGENTQVGTSDLQSVTPTTLQTVNQSLISEMLTFSGNNHEVRSESNAFSLGAGQTGNETFVNDTVTSSGTDKQCIASVVFTSATSKTVDKVQVHDVVTSSEITTEQTNRRDVKSAPHNIDQAQICNTFPNSGLSIHYTLSDMQTVTSATSLNANESFVNETMTSSFACREEPASPPPTPSNSQDIIAGFDTERTDPGEMVSPLQNKEIHYLNESNDTSYAECASTQDNSADSFSQWTRNEMINPEDQKVMESELALSIGEVDSYKPALKRKLDVTKHNDENGSLITDAGPHISDKTPGDAAGVDNKEKSVSVAEEEEKQQAGAKLSQSGCGECIITPARQRKLKSETPVLQTNVNDLEDDISEMIADAFTDEDISLSFKEIVNETKEKAKGSTEIAPKNKPENSTEKYASETHQDLQVFGSLHGAVKKWERDSDGNIKVETILCDLLPPLNSLSAEKVPSLSSQNPMSPFFAKEMSSPHVTSQSTPKAREHVNKDIPDFNKTDVLLVDDVKQEKNFDFDVRSNISPDSNSIPEYAIKPPLSRIRVNLKDEETVRMPRESKDGRRRVKRGSSAKAMIEIKDTSGTVLSSTPLKRVVPRPPQKTRSADDHTIPRSTGIDEGQRPHLRQTQSSRDSSHGVRKIRLMDIKTFPRNKPSIYYPERDPVHSESETNLSKGKQEPTFNMDQPFGIYREKKSSLWKRLKSIIKPPKLVRRDGKFKFVKKYKKHHQSHGSICVETPPHLSATLPDNRHTSFHPGLQQVSKESLHKEIRQADFGKDPEPDVCTEEPNITAWSRKPYPTTRTVRLRSRTPVRRNQWRRFRRLRVLRHSVERMNKTPAVRKHNVSSKNYMYMKDSPFDEKGEDAPLKKTVDGRSRSRRRLKKESYLLDHPQDAAASERCERANSRTPEVFEVFCNDDDIKDATSCKVEPTVRDLMKPSVIGTSSIYTSNTTPSGAGADASVDPCLTSPGQLIDPSQGVRKRPSSSKRWPCKLM